MAVALSIAGCVGYLWTLLAVKSAFNQHLTRHYLEDSAIFVKNDETRVFHNNKNHDIRVTKIVQDQISKEGQIDLRPTSPASQNLPMKHIHLTVSERHHLKDTAMFVKNNEILVFYNVFTQNKVHAIRVTKIVQDQISNLRSYHKVFVRSIGAPLQIIDAIKNATLLRHDEKGDEPETLHMLWEYCKIHPKKKVVYIHTKGSFHPSSNQELQRKYNTKGALSDDCSNLPSSCNVCSSRMTPIPNPHSPGNMWLARCSYVQKLIDPNVLKEAMNRVIYHNLLADDACIGKGRFAAEHWIHSHPSVSPCDLDRNATYPWAYQHFNDVCPGYNFKMELKAAPRFNLSTYDIGAKECGRWGLILQDRLIEYQSLYGAKPSDSWWGWKMYKKETRKKIISNFF